MTDHAAAKRHLRAFFKRLSRRIGRRACGIWRLEYQQRGAIHFHVLFPSLPFIRWQEIEAMWHAIDPDCGRIRIEMIRNKRHAMSYVSKYLAKYDADDVSLSISHIGPQEGFVGRFWGIEGRAGLPWAELITFCWSKRDGSLIKFKRYMRRRWPGIVAGDCCGAFLFVNNAERWLALLLAIIKDRA